MSECKPVGTPLETNVKFEKSMEQNTNHPYQELIGGLMYLANWTRPDISHAVSYLSQFNTSHSDEHWNAAKRVLRYLRGTENYSLEYKRGKKELIGYADADWAGCILDRHSYTGYIIKYGDGLISWRSRKQKTVALSATEAEYMAICETGKEIIDLKGLLKELDVYTKTVTLYNDNQGARKLVENPVYHDRTKHIDVRYHYIRELSERKEIDIKYCETEKMPADMMTKALPKPKHMFCVTEVGLTK
jgi:hypothetical protein